MNFTIFKQPQDVLVETATRFQKKRKQAGYTQTELAKKSGVSLGSLKRFEQSGEINFRSLLQLAHVLDCLGDFEKLFNRGKIDKSIEKLFK